MLSAITVSLVPEARSGPFVFHQGLADACRRAAELGFDAIEIFPPHAHAVDQSVVSPLVQEFGLKVAAVGTGAGWLCHQWSLVSPEESIRHQAREFIRQIIDAAGALGAPAIIGSMQGRAAPAMHRQTALEVLGEAISGLADYAYQRYGLPLLIEPLNRYETNLLNEVVETAQWLRTLPSEHLRLLADLFHMNIEEADMAASLRAAGPLIGHVHFADSNRSAVGFGHSPIAAAVAQLQQLGYRQYLSAEVFPRPDSSTAARQTIDSFRLLTRESTGHDAQN